MAHPCSATGWECQYLHSVELAICRSFLAQNASCYPFILMYSCQLPDIATRVWVLIDMQIISLKQFVSDFVVDVFRGGKNCECIKPGGGKKCKYFILLPLMKVTQRATLLLFGEISEPCACDLEHRLGRCSDAVITFARQPRTAECRYIWNGTPTYLARNNKAKYQNAQKSVIRWETNPETNRKRQSRRFSRAKPLKFHLNHSGWELVKNSSAGASTYSLTLGLCDSILPWIQKCCSFLWSVSPGQIWHSWTVPERERKRE